MEALKIVCSLPWAVGVTQGEGLCIQKGSAMLQALVSQISCHLPLGKRPAYLLALFTPPFLP